ncbi:MAG: bis(5'-nucleosyl)-tetraphosphatase (symmetrical) [Planctomycetia bacterium TMED53]|nr:MAG: bis(5'-nucleosyl)-tetraphosphatase (symmetrical) [Planctomycetia bacterium TMED53]
MDNSRDSYRIQKMPSDIWVIGDVHGCYQTLTKLLDKIEKTHQDPECVFIGDLVGKGPDSEEVLKLVSQRNGRFTSILGNHDLHLMACFHGVSKTRAGDRTDSLLGSKAAPSLINWLQQCDFVLQASHGETQFNLVHAGIHPTWSETELSQRLAKLNKAVKSEDWSWYKNPQSDIWNTANILTRMRCLKIESMELCNDFTGPPDEADQSMAPWFEMEPAANSHCRVVFGHWAALGRHSTNRAECLDSGCVYGGELTALHLSTGKTISVKNAESP